MMGGPEYAAAREALANVVLFGHVMGGVDKPAEDNAEPAPDPRPQRPAGSADQGMRGAAFADNPRQAFVDALRRVL